ncbi:unnamed protein product [Allacma fusca]|uniref:SNTX MACPF/CDC-like domain-containing protein n=1 Tax=Allacma fusca TaxID=39272 RepID=A0A8J2PY39_9HEXA|nr:unnamed protein product [Allacma fusca]
MDFKKFLGLLFLVGEVLAASKSVPEYLQVQSLNRAVDIGYLYNEVTDNIFLLKAVKGEFPPNYTEFVNNPITNYHFKRVRSFSDKLDSLNIDLSAQASLMFGNGAAGGMFSYLTDTNLETDFSYATLTYKATITTELLAIHRLKILENVDTNIGRVLGATHFIIGVEWGTAVLFSMKWRSTSSAAGMTTDAAVDAAFSSTKITAEMGTSYQSLKKTFNKTEDLEVSIYGNLAMGKMSMKSFEEIEEYMMKVPELTTHLNGGKGSPVKFIAVSLDKIDQLKQKLMKGPASGHVWSKESIIHEIEKIASPEDITLYKLHNSMKTQYQEQQDMLQKVRGYHYKATQYSEILPTGFPDKLKNSIERFQQVCGIFKIQMKGVLTCSRNSTLQALEMYNLIEDNYSKDLNGPSSLSKINHDMAIYDDKINTYLWVSKFGVYFLKKSETLEAIRIQNQYKSDVHVFVTSAKSKVIESSIWFDHLEVFVHRVGFKVFVDCDTQEIYNSSCKGFAKRLDEGAVLHKYDKYKNRIFFYKWANKFAVETK